MTSQERVLSALKLGKVDRVPVVPYGINPYRNYWATNDPTYKDVLVAAKEKADIFYRWWPGTNFLKDSAERNTIMWQGYPGTFKIGKEVFWNIQDWPQIGLLGIDCEKVKVIQKIKREKDSIKCTDIIETSKGTLKSVMLQKMNTATPWLVEPYFKNREDVRKFFSLPWKLYEPELSDYFKTKERLGTNGIMFWVFTTPIMLVLRMFNLEDGFITAVNEKKLFFDLLDLVSERLYEVYESILMKNISPAIIRVSGSEYVAPPFFSPDDFEKFVVKYEKPIIHLIKKHNCIAEFHIHGRIKEVLDIILSLEPDSLDPVEPPPSGDISLTEVKKKIGNKICLVGNVEFDDMQRRSPEEIDRKCRETIETAAPGGGFILMPTAPPVTSLSKKMQVNYLQFIESGRRYGGYPIAKSTK